VRRAAALGILLSIGIVACGREEQADSHVNMALVLLREGQVDAAMEQLQRARTGADGEETPPWLPEVVELLLSRRRLDLADSLLSLRSVGGKPAPELLFQAAGLAELRGDLRRADELYAGIDAENARHVDALKKRATLALMEGRASDAANHARAVLARDRFEAKARTILAQALLAEGFADSAYVEIVQTPASATRFLVEGEALLRSGRAEAALTPLSEVLKVQRDAPQPHYLLGQAFLELGDHERAFAELKPLAEHDPPYEEVQMYLARLAQQRGRTARADSLLNAYEYTRRWREAMALRNEGLDKSKVGELEQALGYFQRAQDILPEDPELANDRGAILARLARYEEAERCFLYAIQVKPDNAAAHRNLANLYQLTGNESARDAHMRTFMRLVQEQKGESKGR
jgi:Flp pilus assembly protein TadD